MNVHSLSNRPVFTREIRSEPILARFDGGLMEQRRRLLRKLPDRYHRANCEERVERCFQNISPFFFRLNQESVGRFLFHNCFPFLNKDAEPRRFCLSSPRVIIVFKEWMTAGDELDSKK